MDGHLSLLRDAVEEFLLAFNYYRTLSVASAGQRDPLLAARCVRALYLALEKVFKHSIYKVDPYLLVKKPDHRTLVNLRRDILSREVPSLFCSRQPFETPNLVETWALVREVLEPNIDKPTLDDFGRALARLAETRHRAQHGEFYESIDDLIALLEQVFARARPILTVVGGDVLGELYARNNQLESLLTGIENQIDGAWQVLIDYLQKPNVVRIETVATLIQEGRDRPIAVLIGESRSTSTNTLLAHTELSPGMASGLFALFLSPEQANSRYLTREASRPPGTTSQGVLDLLAPSLIPTRAEPQLPLDPGWFTIDTIAGWLSLDLKGIQPSYLGLSIILESWKIGFEDGQQVEGLLRGNVRSAVQRAGAMPSTVSAQGKVWLTEEWGIQPQPEEGKFPEGATYRRLKLDIDLSAI